MKKEEKTTKNLAKKATTKKTVKEEVKNVETKETLEDMFNTSYKSMTTLCIVVVLIIALAFGLASMIKKDKKTATDNNASIQYSEILLGNLLSQSENSYYVFIYNKDDNYINAYNTYLTSYKSKEGALKVYTAALENGFNKKYLSTEKNLYVSNIDDLKIMGTTLLKVENNRVVEAYDGNESIISHLKQIVK